MPNPIKENAFNKTKGAYSFKSNIDIDKLLARKRNSSLNRMDVIFQKHWDRGLEDIRQQTLDRLLYELSHFHRSIDGSSLVDSEIANNIEVTYYPSGFSIYVNADYAVFVEFGTGINGSMSPHPNTSFALNGWEYANNSWWYPTTADDPNPTKKLGSSGDWVAKTSGVPSRPFMYNTWRWARGSYMNIMQKHLNNAVKEIERGI